MMSDIRQTILVLLCGCAYLMCGPQVFAAGRPPDFDAFLRGGAVANSIDPIVVEDSLLRSIKQAGTIAEEIARTGGGEKTIYLFDGKALRVDRDGSQHELIRRTVMLLDDHPAETVELNVQFNSGIERIEFIFARTITADGEVVAVPPERLPLLTPYEITPFYKNLVTLVIPFPECRAGAVLDYEVVLHRSSPRIPGEAEILFSLQGLVPYLRNYLAVAVPPELRINFTVRRLGTEVEPVEEHLADRRVLIWDIALAQPVVSEPNMPQYADVIPYLSVSSIPRWSTIARKLLPRAAAAVTPDALIREKVAELTAGAASREEQVCRVFEYVQREVVSVKVDLLDAGLSFVPASRILAQGHGASLEKCTLLLSMLDVLEVRAVHGLISTLENGFLDRSFPMLSQFNHCIVVAEVAGELVFLDPSAEWLSYPLLPVEDQGRAVLPLEPGCAGLITTPLSTADDNSIRERIEVEIDPDRGVEIRAVSSTEGEVDRNYRREFALLNTAYLEKVLKRAVTSLYPGAALLSYYVSDPADMAQRLTMGLTFSMPPRKPDQDGRLVLRAPGFHKTSLLRPSADRTYPVCFRFPFKAETEILVFHPPGYQPERLPEDIDFRVRGSRLTIRSRVLEPGRLQISFCYTRDTRRIETEDFPAYRRLADLLARFAESTLVFHKTK